MPSTLTSDEMVAATAATAKPPSTIEEFLCNIHIVLAEASHPLQLDQLTDVYFKQLGHKCNVKNFLVVGEGGLAATLKRIPHIVTLYTDNGAVCCKATQPAEANRQDLIEADQAYRRELLKKNAMAKAAAAKAKPKAATPPAIVTAAAAEQAVSEPQTGEKRPAESPAVGANAGKVAKTGGDDLETLARMLVQGVVRVLQNRQKQGKGLLPVNELEEEFKLLWKVPFNLQQAGEDDAVTFLQKWPNKVTVTIDNGITMVALCKKPAADAASKAGGQTATKAAPPKATAPITTATAAKSGGSAPMPGVAPKSSAPTAAAAGAAVAKAGAVAAAADATSPTIPQRPGGPTRPPASIEDFLWNMHSVAEAYGGPLPLEHLKDAYSKHLGHKCAIERFLVVPPGSGIQGLASTLSRIPHVVTVDKTSDGVTVLKCTQPNGTTREQLIQADQNYRKQLQQKNQAAKAAAKQPVAAGAVGSDASPQTSATSPTPVAARKSPPPVAAVQKSPAPDAAGGDAKKARTGEEDRETLAKMLIQGVVRVLQTRAKEGKGALAITSLEEEFKATWKVPFNLAQAGENDIVTFLRKWPNKVEILEGAVQMVQLAKKGAGKASATAPPTTTQAVAAATVAAPTAAAGNGMAATTPRSAEDVMEASQALSKVQLQAAEMLQAMQDMVRRQEALVNALNQIDGVPSL